MSDTHGRVPVLSRIAGGPTYLRQALHKGRRRLADDPVSQLADSQPREAQSPGAEDRPPASGRGLGRSRRDWRVTRVLRGTLVRMQQTVLASAGETLTRQRAGLAVAVGVLLLGLSIWAVCYSAFATPQASQIAALAAETARQRETIRALQMRLNAAVQRETLPVEAAASQSQVEAVRHQGADGRPVTVQQQMKVKPHRPAKRVERRVSPHPSTDVDLRPASIF
jgi:hypothetical protein